MIYFLGFLLFIGALFVIAVLVITFLPSKTLEALGTKFNKGPRSEQNSSGDFVDKN